jgi:hypothetical protein
MILTDKDAKTLENNTKFKSVELNENFINVDMKTGVEKIITKEEDRPNSPDDLQISHFEAKKLNESHIQSMR